MVRDLQPPQRKHCGRGRQLLVACQLHVLALACLVGTSTQQSIGASLVIVYGNPDVVHNVEVPALLLDAVRPSGQTANESSGRFEVALQQPADLDALLLARYSTAAYVIPFQGPNKLPYVEAEHISDDANGTLASLRSFVSGGGSLVLLGNTGQERGLGLLASVLGRPHGCEPATARFRVGGSSSSTLLPSLSSQTMNDVFLPLGGAGGEEGGAGLLACSTLQGSIAADGPSAVPLFGEVGVWRSNAGGSSSDDAGSLVSTGPGFVWASGRGRVVWIGVTFDKHTSADWVRVLAAAVAAPPLPAGGGASGPPPPAGPRPLPPPPELWRGGSSSGSPPYPPHPQALPPPMNPPSPSLRSPPTPPSPGTNTSQAPPPAASRPSPPLPTPGPTAAGVPPPRLPVGVPPSPPQASPPLSPGANGGIDSVKLPPGSFIAEEIYPPSEPPSPPAPPDLPSPPALPPSPPSPPSSRLRAASCVDFPDGPALNCTAWLELPDMDVCEPGFVVPSPEADGSRDMSVRDEVCPRACGTCCTNKYFECERWAEEGLCSWLYVITDPDTGVEEIVPEACQLSCEAAACGADGADGVSRQRRSLAGTRNQQLKTAANEPGKVVPPLDSDWKDSTLRKPTASEQKEVLRLLEKSGPNSLYGSPRLSLYDTVPGTRIISSRKDGGLQLVMRQVFGIEGDTMQDGREVRFGVLEFQTADDAAAGTAIARAFLPLGYGVLPEVVEAALRQSATTQRSVSILPPLTKVYGKGGAKATRFEPFSSVEVVSVSATVGRRRLMAGGDTKWSVVEASVTKRLTATIQQSSQGNQVSFTFEFSAELTHSESKIGCGQYNTETNDVDSVSADWDDDSKPGGCGCKDNNDNGGNENNGSDGGNGSDDNGGGRDCKIKFVRDSDGKKKRRRICTGSNR